MEHEQKILKPVKPLDGKYRSRVVQFDTESGECIRIDNFHSELNAKLFYEKQREEHPNRTIRLIEGSE